MVKDARKVYPGILWRKTDLMIPLYTSSHDYPPIFPLHNVYSWNHNPVQGLRDGELAGIFPEPIGNSGGGYAKIHQVHSRYANKFAVSEVRACWAVLLASMAVDRIDRSLSKRDKLEKKLNISRVKGTHQIRCILSFSTIASCLNQFSYHYRYSSPTVCPWVSRDIHNV